MLKVNNYVLKSNKIKKDLTILNISDIHNKDNYLDSVTKYIKRKKIDYILMPGDILDRHNLKNEDKFIKSIINLSKDNKIIMVPGNHDKYDILDKNKIYTDKDYENSSFYKKLKNNKNIKLSYKEFEVLENKNNISISTITLNNAYYRNKEKEEDFKKIIKNIEKNNKLDSKNFNILLIHSPNCLISNNKIINYSNLINNTDLILCGHNHGGLVPTWIQDKRNNHRGFVGPFDTFFPNNSYGIYSNDNKNLLISNGLTKVNDISFFKWLNKILIPEIDLIHIEASNKNSFKLNNRKKYKI